MASLACLAPLSRSDNSLEMVGRAAPPSGALEARRENSRDQLPRVMGNLRPGYYRPIDVIWGTVVGTDRRPLPNATIIVRGVTFAGENIRSTARSNANGAYSLRIAPGRYKLEAWVDRQYNGTRFSLPLHPTDDDQGEFDPGTGGRKDFEWLMSGAWSADLPDNPEFFYGQHFNVTLETITSTGIDQRVVEFTFVPEGPLIDGSRGRVVIKRRSVGALKRSDGPLGASHTLHDIPIGNYFITAALVLPQGRFPVVMRGTPFAPPALKLLYRIEPSPYWRLLNPVKTEELWITTCQNPGDIWLPCVAQPGQ